MVYYRRRPTCFTRHIVERDSDDIYCVVCGSRYRPISTAEQAQRHIRAAGEWI